MNEQSENLISKNEIRKWINKNKYVLRERVVHVKKSNVIQNAYGEKSHVKLYTFLFIMSNETY